MKLRVYEVNPQVAFGNIGQVIIRGDCDELSPHLVADLSTLSIFGNTSLRLREFACWRFTEANLPRALTMLQSYGYCPSIRP